MVTIHVQQRATGVYQLIWWDPHALVPPGDALVADVRYADASWYALADLLVDPRSPCEQPATGASRTMSPHGTAPIRVMRPDSFGWVFASPEEQAGTLALLCRTVLRGGHDHVPQEDDLVAIAIDLSSEPISAG